jgi:uncharacterized protein YegL
MASGNLLPFYLVCDTSASMRADGRIDAMNGAVAATCDVIAAHPVIADRVRLGVLSFSDAAHVELPLCDPTFVDWLPTLRPEGMTSYAAAFRLLRKTIEGDVRQLAADDFRIYRPAAFFFSDGAPTDRADDWRRALADLLDPRFPHRPNTVSFGFGDADPGVLATVATVASYRATDGTAPAAAIAAFGTTLVESIVASGRTGGFQVPDALPPELDVVDHEVWL